MFSWPLSPPLAVICVDLWIPDKFINIKGNLVLMNDIYDISQFVVVVPVTNEYSVTLAENCF